MDRSEISGFISYKISILRILDRSFSIYLAEMKVFYVLFTIINVFNVVLARAAFSLLPSFNVPFWSLDDFLRWLVDYGAPVILIISIFTLSIWLITSFGNSIAIRYVSDIFEGRGAEILRSIKGIFHLLGRLLTVNLIVGTLMITGFILMLFPGLIMTLIFSLSLPAMIIEQLGVFSSLRRSRELTDNMWWKTFLLLSAIFLIFVLAYSLAEGLSTFLNSYDRQTLIGDIIKVLIISLIEPLYPISVTHLYYELRRKKVAHPIIEAYKKYYPNVMRKCYYCGQILPCDALYCPNCGRRLWSRMDGNSPYSNSTRLLGGRG